MAGTSTAEVNRRGLRGPSEEAGEPARNSRASTGSWHNVWDDPYLLIAAGLGVAIPALFVWRLLPFGFWALPLVPCAVVVCRGAWLLLRRGPRRSGATAFGGEKQLLMAMAAAGGSISPVRAALETSLTVDEAEEILSRLADRGHLFVESHDGALFYRMPREQTASDSR